MRSFLLSLLSLAALAVHAQDTITVRTLTFDSITTRRGWWQFPDATHHYRKVLMVHTLKCDAQTTQDQYACGEWDYLTYHFIHEHTGQLDSLALTHADFLVGTAAPDSADVLDLIRHDHQQRQEVHAQVVQPGDLQIAYVGPGGLYDPEPLSFANGTTRSQYVFHAEELELQGMTGASEIHVLRFPMQNAQGSLRRLTVRLKNTLTGTLSSFDNASFTTVFDGAVALSGDTLEVPLTTAFTWNGAPYDLLVDLAAETEDASAHAELEAGTAQEGSAVHEIGRDGYLDLRDDFVGVDPAPMAGLGDAITITFRVFGAPGMPVNASMIEGLNDQGQRLLNIHLPWSDGNVYWDAGNDGTGYDRINKAAQPADMGGQWNEWAFVKNASTGVMKIYLNGTLWHSGTGKTKPMTGITQLRIGSGANGEFPYPGLIDEVNIFNTELDAATIAAWTGRKANTTHPHYADLLYRFSMDDGEGDPVVHNAVDPAHPAWSMGTVRRDRVPAVGLGRDVSVATLRPVIGFGWGSPVMELDTTLVEDPVPGPQIALQYFTVQGNYAVPSDTVFGGAGGWERTFGTDGTPIDSSLISGTVYHNGVLAYYGVPFPVVNDHEIGRYITPYGIGLSLGSNGFSWVYDVTDYQWLMHDSVEVSAGNQQELIDLRFLLIEGTPPAPVVNVQHPWGYQRSYSYASLSDDSELAPRTVQVTPGATRWTMRSRLTGHGDATSIPNVQGCCEFRDNTHSLWASGQQADSWHIWQTHDCATNAVYPQGGTWIYAREGWCPGDAVKERETDLTPFVSGGALNVDYRITPVPQNNPGMGGGNYVVSMDLFEFGPPSHQRDADLYEVLRPTNAGIRSRQNPICYDPALVLRNSGATALTSVTFEYQVSGGAPAHYTWTGDLASMARTQVDLPIGDPSFWSGDDQHQFTARITDVNGQGGDDNADNDAYRTTFDLPTVYPDVFVVYFKTNNSPDQDHLTIRNAWNDVVFEHGNFDANTTYRDTLHLTTGCYTLDFTDSGDNGLSFWAEPDEGSGFFRFRSLTNQTLRNFNADFGNNIHAAFAIGGIVNVPELQRPFALSAAPVPNDGHFRLNVTGVLGDVRIEVLDATGRKVADQAGEATGSSIPMDLSAQPDGLYLVRVASERGVATLRVMKGR